jgi:membrane protease subunit HflK
MNWDWEKLQEKRQRQGGGKSPFSQGEGPGNPFDNFNPGAFLSKFFNSGRLPIGTLLIVAVLIWLASGIFIVKPGEVGVVTRFGKFHREVHDGPHYRIPSPVERAIVVVADPLRTLLIGQGIHGAEEASMFTGDENIVHLEFNVQYNISYPYRFLFHVRDPEGTVKSAAEAAMREVVGRSMIDNIMTVDRAEIQAEALQVLEDILTVYDMGVRIHTVQLLNVQPPSTVEPSFRDVASAREDRIRRMNEAEAYRMQIVPVASGTAQSMLNAAYAYARQVEEAAIGEAQRFLAIAGEYSKARDVTRQRMYLEAMRDMLSSSGVQKVVISRDANSNVLPLLNLNPPSAPAR